MIYFMLKTEKTSKLWIFKF